MSVPRGQGLLLGLASVLCFLASSSLAEARVPRIKHVFVIVLENKNYHETFDRHGDAPYLAKTLPRRGAKLPRYFATGHLSLDNYISMVSGQGPNIVTQSDCQTFQEFAPAVPTDDGQFIGQGCVYPAAVPTLADQLEDAGLRWRAYMEDMANGGAGEPKRCRHPAVGAMDDTQSAEVGDQYATRHNPFVYFHSIIDEPSCERRVVDFRRMRRNLRRRHTTPAYSFITPNLCHDGHDVPCVNGKPGGLTTINHWLRRQVPRITRSAGYRDHGLLLITFDEAEAEGGDGDARACCSETSVALNTPNPGGLIVGPGGGRTGMVALSPCIRPGKVIKKPFNHYSMLRSVEDLFGLPHIGYAASPNPGSFNRRLFRGGPCSG